MGRDWESLPHKETGASDKGESREEKEKGEKMKVEIEGEKKVEFKEIYDGECFKDVSGELFIKRCNSEEYNATRLYDGEIFAYGIEKLVIPVNAKVVVGK